MGLRLIKKISILLVPFVFSLPIYWLNFELSGGDLNRLGKVSVEEDYRENIIDQLNIDSVEYIEWHPELTSGKYDIVTIGDSFSQLEMFGYQNYLENINDDISVLNISNKYLDYGNPFQDLIALMNGDFFENIHTKYIILQSVERTTNNRTTNLDFHITINIHEMDVRDTSIVNSSLNIIIGEIYDSNFYLFSNFLYKFDDNAYFSKVYKFDTNKDLFTSHNDILIYKDDIGNLEMKNNLNGAINTNNILNEISNMTKLQDIELIFLPAPDKYTIYQNYLINSNNNHSIFFDNFYKLEKNYHLIDSYNVLSKAVKNNILDIYYYDDTHWFSIGSEIIAQEILRSIKSQD